MIRNSISRFVLVSALLLTAACASSPANDPRVGLKPGLMDAGQALGGLALMSTVQSPAGFHGITNSDLAFSGSYAIQGNYNGFQIWDMSTPSSAKLVKAYACPGSQNDVSVYRNLLFLSVEGNGSTVDCKSARMDPVSPQRFRGVRIFDISNANDPKFIANVQTCRGSHTHTVLEDPRDRENVYVYVSGSAGLRSPNELAGCLRDRPDSNPNSALWRIEVIKVPLANPSAAAIVNRADIFTGLKAAPEHGEAEADIIAARKTADSARAKGGFVIELPSGTSRMPYVLGPNYTRPMLDSIVRSRGATGAPTAADSTALRGAIQGIIERMFGMGGPQTVPGVSDISINSQCHDITVFPSMGIAGGACEGHGLLIDIRDPANPRRIASVADSNFSYWHSATFNNDGTKVLFSDEWGGGGGPKCRASDKKEWGGNAIFELVNGKMEFRSYYKMPAVQTALEVCVAHNGSLIPIPGRDVMVQSWYEGGISVFDWTDARNPVEIAYFDRGPSDSAKLGDAGSWSAYWYNGTIVSSEIGRGIDMLAMTPTKFVTQNEIDAANTVKLSYLNAQGQPKFSWPPSYPLARAYVDQLERNKCLAKGRVSSVRQSLADAEKAGAAGKDALRVLATSLDGDMNGSCDKPKLQKLQRAIQDLAQPIVP
jgi:hypothetical protein